MLTVFGRNGSFLTMQVILHPLQARRGVSGLPAVLVGGYHPAPASGPFHTQEDSQHC